MKRVCGQGGFTLVEMLVGMVLSLIVFGAVMTCLQVFQADSQADQRRNETQDTARTLIDRLSLQLRNVASPQAGAPGALELAGPYDIVFETVDPSQAYGGQNLANQLRVRYCLDASSPGGETLWRQTQTWTSSTAPAIPSTSACPSSAWGGRYAAVQGITNLAGGRQRPLFSYGPAGASTTAQITSVGVDLFLNPVPSRPKAEVELTSGVFLRNTLAPPVASFSLSQVNGHVLLNASASHDPQGQALSYQWAVDGSAIAGATTQQYDAGAFSSASTHNFSVTVTNTGGLSSSSSLAATIQ